MTTDKRFSLAARLLGLACLVMLAAAGISIWLVGFGFYSGAAVALAGVGMIAPCILAGGSLVEIVLGLFELIAESIGTLLDAVLEFFSSLF
jgi:hypothetical protein